MNEKEHTATILVTNDDGVDPEKAHAVALGRALASLGHDVIVVAPFENKSGFSHAVSMSNKLSLRRHKELEMPLLHVYSLDGTPVDCTIAAIEPEVGVLARLQRYARLCVSGINVGPNLGINVIYSGTVGAARQAAMYGIPAIATSIAASYHRSHSKEVSAIAVDATVRVVEAALAVLPLKRSCEQFNSDRRKDVTGACDAFVRGNLILNVNVPEDWSSGFATVPVDSFLYKGAVCVGELPEGNEPVRLKSTSGYIEVGGTADSDNSVVKSGFASISVLQTFPWSHPWWVSQEIMKDACTVGKEGMPVWLGGLN